MAVSLTRQQVRRVDRLAIEQIGIPGMVLMENAGRNAARSVLGLIDERKISPARPRVAVVCGGGNNGGDGYVVARHLHNAGVVIVLHPAKDPGTLTGDALRNYTAASKMGIEMRLARDEEELAAASADWDRAQVIVDALLGTGFSGAVRPPIDAVINRINEARSWGASIVSLDLPSGLDCDTGRPAKPTVRADLTVTFVARKVGFDRHGAAEFLGRVVVADIGAPTALIHQVAAEKDMI